LVTSCLRTGFENTILKERYKGAEDEEEDVKSLRKGEDIGIE
jgi:hypothetical protein